MHNSYTGKCVGGPVDGTRIVHDSPSKLLSNKRSHEGRLIDPVEHQFTVIDKDYPEIGIWTPKGQTRLETLLLLANNYKPTRGWEPGRL